MTKDEPIEKYWVKGSDAVSEDLEDQVVPTRPVMVAYRIILYGALVWMLLDILVLPFF